MMRPEWALFGTCTIIPTEELARWAVGELLEMRAFQLCGNATTMPVRRLAPLISSSPPSDTWRRLVEQRIVGVHVTLVSVYGFLGLAGLRFAGACLVAVGALLAVFGALPPVALLDGAGVFEGEPSPAGVPPPPGAVEPPTLVAASADSWAGRASAAQSRQGAKSATLAPIGVDCLCVRLKTVPSRPVRLARAPTRSDPTRFGTTGARPAALDVS